MPKVSWDRREEIESAYSIKPAVKKAGRKDFRIPPTAENDFERWLNQDVPHVNFTFE